MVVKRLAKTIIIHPSVLCNVQPNWQDAIVNILMSEVIMVIAFWRNSVQSKVILFSKPYLKILNSWVCLFLKTAPFLTKNTRVVAMDVR